MTIKTVRVLQSVAVILYAAALAIAILAVPLQSSFLSLYGRSGANDPRVIPFGAIAKALLNFVPAVIYLVLLKKWKPTVKGSRALSIAFAVALAVQQILLSFILNFLVDMIVSRLYGVSVLAAYTVLSGAISWISVFFTVPAEILMLLSLGGYWGKDLTWIENCTR